MTEADNLPIRNEDRPVAVKISGRMLRVKLADGRVIAAPLTWYPRLLNATPEQLQAFELTPTGIHWGALGEDLSIVGMLQSSRPPQRKDKA